MQAWRLGRCLGSRARQRPARYARIVLVSALLAFVAYHTLRSRAGEAREHEEAVGGSLRLRVRLKGGGQGPKPLTPQQLRSMRQPIEVAIMTGHYFGDGYGREITGCSLGSIPLNCSFIPDRSKPFLGNINEVSRAADAVWWHAPNTCMLPGGPWGDDNVTLYSTFKARADQLAVIASMESSEYYKCLDDPHFMSRFDVHMTYHRASEVPLLYWDPRYKRTWEETPPLPLSEKLDSVVFINSNCGGSSGRTEIVSSLMQQPGVQVDALGRCLSNGTVLGRGPDTKIKAFRKYKFCIAIENSLATDYVTEKIYDSLAAGCLPIYYGAPNIREFIPSMEGILDYRTLGGTPEALAAELRRLSKDDAAYARKFEWQKHPESWGQEFKEIHAQALKGVHTQCQVCQVIARHRAKIPDPSTGKLLESKYRPPNITRPLPGTHVRNMNITLKMAGDAPPSPTVNITFNLAKQANTRPADIDTGREMTLRLLKKKLPLARDAAGHPHPVEVTSTASVIAEVEGRSSSVSEVDRSGVLADQRDPTATVTKRSDS